jgi:hypothetical protein
MCTLSLAEPYVAENAVYKIGDISPLGRFGLLGVGLVVY